MKIFRWIIGAVVVATLLTTGGLVYRQKRQDGEIRHLRSENTRLRGEAYRRQASASAPVASAAEAAHTSRAKPAEPAARKIEEYRHEGRATARATLQTLAWSCDRTDVEALMQLTQLEPEARTKAEAYYANLPADVRGRWKSADEMVATFVMLGAQMSPFPSADVLDAAVMEPVGEDQVQLRVQGTNKDRLPFRRGPDGNWNVVVDAAMMDRLFAVAKNLPPPAR